MLNVHTDLLDDLDAQEYFLASHIARHLNKLGRCWPSLTRLMELTGWSKNTVLKVRRRLVKKGVYCTERHQDDTGRNASTNYQLTTGQIRLYAGEESRLDVMVQNLNHQQILVVHPVNPDGSRNEPEVLSREVLSRPTYQPPASANRFDVDELEDLDRQCEAEEKEKCSAQKEKPAAAAAGPARTLDEVMRAAADRVGWKAGFEPAIIRSIGPSYEQVTEEDTDRLSAEDLTEAVMAEIETPAGARRLEQAARAAGVDLPGLNVYAAVYACAQYNAGRRHLAPGALIRKLPGYLKTEARKALQDQALNAKSRQKINSYATPQSNRWQNGAAHAAADLVSDEACYTAAESYLRKRMEREAAGWG